MIFIHRLGIVLFALALLFAIVSLLVALNGLTSGGPISEACVFAVLSVVSWLWGRAMKYILTDMWADRLFQAEPINTVKLAEPVMSSRARSILICLNERSPQRRCLNGSKNWVKTIWLEGSVQPWMWLRSAAISALPKSSCSTINQALTELAFSNWAFGACELAC
jgi:hypothetical protein